jgi:hypothetical protein
MQGPGEESVCGAKLHQLAEIHDCHPIRDVPNHGQIVGDEEICEPAAVAEVGEEIEHLGLHGDVEGGYRLVEDDKLGFDRKGACDSHSLPLSARQFVWIALGE